jgi:hypothetical protein
MGSVAEYASHFNKLMHNLTAHHNSWEAAYFVTHFVDGLQWDIRAAVILHQPKDLDTVVDLALLQEGVLESYRHETRRANFSLMPCALPRNVVPLPPPPAACLDSSPPQHVDDKRGTNSFPGTQVDNKSIALRNYRRARGLCFTCGEHFSREHHCGPMVQLHIVEELLALVQPAEDNPVKEEQVLTDAGSQLMHISQAASDGGQAANSMRL